MILLQEKRNLVPVKVIPTANGHDMSVATAFFYSHRGVSHLITNWHVVTGLHPDSRAILHDSCAVPDALKLYIPMPVEENGNKGIRWLIRVFDLFSDADRLCPCWQEHPIFGSRIDVVSLPIFEVEETTSLFCANSSQLDLTNIQIYPGLDAFVLGYPRGLTGGSHLPLWKRGSIATEPAIDIDGLPKIYIDTATREGMSGAPVYAQDVGFVMPEGTTDISNALLGKAHRFLGVYSGRLGAEDEFKAQLGIVWKESAIQAIIDASLVKMLRSQPNAS